MKPKEWCHACKLWVDYNEEDAALHPGDTFTAHTCHYCSGDTSDDGPRCSNLDCENPVDDDEFGATCEECDPFSFTNIKRGAGIE